MGIISFLLASLLEILAVLVFIASGIWCAARSTAQFVAEAVTDSNSTERDLLLKGLRWDKLRGMYRSTHWKTPHAGWEREVFEQSNDGYVVTNERHAIDTAHSVSELLSILRFAPPDQSAKQRAAEVIHRLGGMAGEW